MTIKPKVSLCLALLVHVLCLSLVFLSPAQAASQKEELEIGRMVHAQISSKNVLMEDPIVNDYFRRIAQKVLKAAGPQPYPFHFYVIRSPYLNAFAVPGGYIYLHTETFISLENEGQLASILSHEVAHITSRHFARRSEAGKSIGLLSVVGLLAGVALAGVGGGGQNTAALGQALMIGSSAASIQAMLAHSRADETEADSKGRQYLIKAGYNPRDMYMAFKVMNEKSYQLSGNVPGYLRTHPGLTARLASTFADQSGAPPAPVDPAYLAIQDRVLALTGLTARATKIFAKRLSENPSDASALHGLGLLAYRELNYTKAEELISKALAITPNNGEYLTDMGSIALQRNKPADAIRHYEAARKNGYRNIQTSLGLARAYELTGRPKDASSLYDQVTGEANDYYPTALEKAGLFFGQNGQRAKGHFLLSTFYESTGRPKDSIFHCKAATESPGGASYITKCDTRKRNLEELMEITKKAGIGLRAK
ncbi:MAG: M48 family metalloprotease [Deltaproteobacteria bacterium]|jgi:predicted Zn-dependent protease|nr:M48 family metalloprotease [Deltaproteobacteria bacterium]